MNAVKRIIDLNAHVENLSCTISVENKKPYGIISFTNLGYGTLSAIKLIAKGFNSFGDQIAINGKGEFFIILQDLNIPANTEVTNIKVDLPDISIRKVDLREGQLIFSDGSLISYSSPNLKEYMIDALTESDAYEKDILDVLRDYESTSVCLPRKEAEGWICVCGQFNNKETVTCSRCAKAFSDTIVLSNQDELNRRIQKKREEKAKESELAGKKAIQVKKQKKVRNIGIIAGGIVVACIIALITNASILASRVIYNSTDEMIDDLEGTWFYKSGYSDHTLWTIKIDGETLTQTYLLDDLSLDAAITYHPSRGYFEALGNKYIVSKVGYQTMIKEDDYVYQKGDLYTSTTTSAPLSTSDEFDTYLEENGITLDNSDVQYNMANNVDKMFALVGYAELDDYYNYGFDDDIESTYFCLSVTPLGGSYSDQWYIYCHRDSFQKLFDKAQDNGQIYVQMVCEIPSYRFEKNQQCMAQLHYVVY